MGSKYRDKGRKYPLIYISALMRTGSTVLSEMLTLIPYAFIFREPHIGKNYFAAKNDDVDLLCSFGIDMKRFLKFRLPLAFLLRRLRVFGYRQDYMVRSFQKKLLPQLHRHIMQIGVKEIKHGGWLNYVRHFPDMKVVMTGRDPRDIYISAYKHWKNKRLNSRQKITPEKLSAQLNEQFLLQLAIREETKCFEVRYEDLCIDITIFSRIKEFVGSPIPAIGEIGQFNIQHPKRMDEYQLHGNKLTSKSVQRWKREPNQTLVKDAHQVFERMPKYTKFWGYRFD